MRYLLLLLLIPSVSLAQIFRATEKDDILVNQYSNLIAEYAKKVGVENAFGFSKSVTMKKGECYETTIVFFRDKDGEVHDRIVRARLLSYGDLSKLDSSLKVTEQEINTDSLTFKAKTVTKSKDGYLVVGNVSDRGVDIPIVLSTAKAEPKPEPIKETKQMRFATTGNPFNANGRVVGCMFKCIDSADVILIKIIRNDHVTDFYGGLNDRCYSEAFLVPLLWWNGGRSGLGWDAQLRHMRANFVY